MQATHLHSCPLISPAQCEFLARQSESLPAHEGLVYGRHAKGQVDRSQYIAREVFINLCNSAFAPFVFPLQKALDYVSHRGRLHALVQMEWPRLLTYETGGHFDWHRDGVPQSPFSPLRKITGVVQLSSPDDYEGGELVVRAESGEAILADQTQGSASLFDASLLHRVAPVTRGVRRSLVFWGY